MLLLGMASHLWVTPEPGSSVLSHSAHSTPASAFFSTLIRPQLNPNDALCPPPYISPFWGAKAAMGQVVALLMWLQEEVPQGRGEAVLSRPSPACAVGRACDP